MAIKGKKKSKPLFLCFVYSCHDNKKHESVYQILRRMNPKNPKSLYSGCDVLSFPQQTVHAVQTMKDWLKQVLWYALCLLFIHF